MQIATGKEDNDLLTALVKASLSSTEYKVILLVIRKTYGYKKKEDFISLSQLAYYTNRTRRAIIKSTRSLENKNILVRKRRDGKMSLYSINKNFTTWKITREQKFVGNKSSTTREQKGNQLGNKSIHTKESITKETNTKEYILIKEKWEKLFHTKLKADRTKNFKARRKIFSLEEIITAMNNLAKDKFMLGDNDNGKCYATFEYLLRNDSIIEKYLQPTNKPIYEKRSTILA